MDSENHSVVIRSIGSHCEIDSIKTDNIDGYIINVIFMTITLFCKLIHESFFLQRKTHESISSALEKLKFEEYASQYRQLNYCREVGRLPYIFVYTYQSYLHFIKHAFHKIESPNYRLFKWICVM